MNEGKIKKKECKKNEEKKNSKRNEKSDQFTKKYLVFKIR